MKRFLAMLMLAGGLLVAGGANAADIPSTGTLNCLANTTVSAAGAPGDALVINNFGSCAGFVATSNTAAVVGGPVTINNGAQGGLSISSSAAPGLYASAITITNVTTTVQVDLTVTGSAPTAQAVPSLSEWAQLMLGLMVMMLFGWHFHRERSY